MLDVPPMDRRPDVCRALRPAGIFQDSEFRLTTEIFIDEKPGFYEMGNATHKMTGQEVFAQFTQK